MNRRRVLATCGIAAVAGCLRLEQDTEEGETTRGDGGDGDDDQPEATPPTLEAEWSFRARAPMSTRPVYENGTVFVGSDDDHLYAFEAATGQERWRTELDDDPRTLAVDGDLAVVTESSATIGLDATTGETAFTHVHRANQRKPLVTDEGVYTTEYGTLTALDRDGTERWTLETGSEFWGRPALSDGVLVASDEGESRSSAERDTNVYAIDSESGEPRWERRYEADSLLSDIAISDGVATVAGRDGTVVAFDLEDGSVRWERSFDHNENVIHPFPIRLSQDVLVVPNNVLDTTFGLDPTTGETDWEIEVDFWEIGPRFSAVEPSDGILYGANHTRILGIDPSVGEVIFEQSILDRDDVDDIEVAPAVTESALYFTDETYLHAIERENEHA